MERERTNQTKPIVDLLGFTDNGWLEVKQMSGRDVERSPAYLHLKVKLEWNLYDFLGLGQGFLSRGFGDHRLSRPISLRIVEVSDRMANLTTSGIVFDIFCAFSMRLAL